MTREKFLAELEQALASLPYAERRDALNYYEEYLDSAGPENEAQTIADLGSPQDVARKILESNAEPSSDTEVEAETKTEANPKKASAKKKKPYFTPFDIKVLIVAAVILLLTWLLPSSSVKQVSSSNDTANPSQTSTSSSFSNGEVSSSTSLSMDEPENSDDSNSDSTLTIPLSDLEQELRLDLGYGSVAFLVNDTLSDAVFQFKDFKDVYLTHSTEADGKSSITYKLPSNYNVGLDPEPQLTISLPADALNTLTVDLALGNLDLNTLTIPTLSVDLALGNLNAAALTADSLVADLSMGNFTAQSLLADKASLQLKMGNLSLDQLTCGDFDADLSLGNAYIGQFSGINTASISVSMGNVDLSFEGAPSDYDIHVNSMMGGFLNTSGDSLKNDDPSSSRKLSLNFVTCDTVLHFLH